MGKRYYWLKLKDDFFHQLPIKKLRRIAGGDTYTIIYLKMMLVAMKADGILNYNCPDDEFAETLALDIDEDEENVKVAMQFLLANNLLIQMDNGDVFLPEAKDTVGSEQASAKRVREFRVREKAKALQCNSDVTEVKRLANGEKEIEKEIEKEVDVVNTSATTTYNPISDVEKMLAWLPSQGQAEMLISIYQETGATAFHKALERAARANAKNITFIENAAKGIASGDDYEEKKKQEELAQQESTLSPEQRRVYDRLVAEMKAKKNGN